MTLVVVTPPDPIVTYAEAKAQLRLDADDDQALVEALIQAATETIDGADGWLGRALGEQQWALKMDGRTYLYGRPLSPWWGLNGWGCWQLRLPLPPLVSVDSVAYRDENGDAQTYAADNYEVAGVGSTWPGSLVLKDGASWPSVYAGPEAITVTFTAGYGAGEDVPVPIRHAILMMVSRLYEGRGDPQNVNVRDDPMIDALLAPYRVWF